MDLSTLVLFCGASLALAVTPGPTMLLALSNGLRGGLGTAAWGILGATLASGLLIAGVAVGLGTLLAASERLFEGLRWGGVAYLCWLAIGLWRQRGSDLGAAAGEAPAALGGRSAFLRSAGVSLSNPKAILFFSAFLPQFVDPHAPQAAQYAVLGTVFVGIDALVMLAYAAAGRRATGLLGARGVRGLQRGCAVAMLALAATLAGLRRGVS